MLPLSMLRQLWLQACLLACASAGASACFSPTIQEGRACSESDRCPGGQVCTAGTCKTPGQNNVGPDANVVGGSDGRRTDSGGLCGGSETFAPITPAGIQNFSVPACATNVTIEAFGAQGGGTQSDSGAGGKGARMKGDFALTGGVDLLILVGEAGLSGSPAAGFEQGGGTGGGGSFVIDDTNTPMVIAAGGGGATEGPEVQRGGPGQIGLEAQDGGGHDDSGGFEVASFEGGLTFASTANGFHGGTGGGSFVSPGENDSDGLAKYGTPNSPGNSFMNGGAGGVGGSLGRDGGFGGGGASGFTGGGGGGYTGGGAGGLGIDSSLIGGGGGGSINNGTSPDNSPGVNTGPGKVTVNWR